MERKSDTLNTETVATPGVTSSRSSGESRVSSHLLHDEGRFVPGALLGGRYRIIELLGRGGMGEVYRATDLTLGQSVALKFLPEEAAANQRLLERFHGEVRVARQVAHPNVCRVYDINQAEGTPFISMEYVDGEDLGSLLLRIGRLPSDKAVETARKLCAGLAAAHDRGVIHRDLKPQNIMMNKRGEVVIMDFGLAAVVGEFSGTEARSGTPAYMAPEQLKGAEVTAKSDIYALGLVLYELFTGKRPYEAKTVQELIHQQESTLLTSMTSVASDIDPAVEKAIRRCLEVDPAKRPVSALAVSAALPGGDPLAAALAAGETPSPELVASAGNTEGMSRKYSVPCLVLVFLCLCGATLIRGRYYALMHSPLDYGPEVLGQKARDIAASLGYPKKPVDSEFGFEHRRRLISHLSSLPEPRKWENWLAAEAPISLFYRESLAPLVAYPFGKVSMENPPPLEPGMVFVEVDGHGRLRGFSAMPYKTGETLTPAVLPENVFRAAGLDIAGFTETTPVTLPQNPADQLQAWKGPHPSIPNTDLSVEIGSWKGRITHVKFEWPWNKVPEAGLSNESVWVKIRGILLLFLAAAGIVFGVLLARRNWKLARVDRKGALRIAIAHFLLNFLVWIGTVHALASEEMIFSLFRSGAQWLMSGAMIWLLYLALEPALRARWPHSIVTWNRILAGRWLDPQVGSHILIGATVGCAMWIAAEWFSAWAGPRNTLSYGGPLFSTLGTRQWLSGHADRLAAALTFSLLSFFAIFGLRRLLRSEILAAIAASVLFILSRGDVFNSAQWQVRAIILVSMFGILIFFLLRSGLVTTMSAIFFIDGTNAITLGTDWKTWYAPAGLATLLFLLGIALFAFWRSLGSRELLGGAEVGA